jgi:hypothetical protein
MSDCSKGGTPDPVPQVQAVTCHRDSAHQISIPIQRDQVREWANRTGLEIVYEFSDRGKSQRNVPA